MDPTVFHDVDKAREWLESYRGPLGICASDKSSDLWTGTSKGSPQALFVPVGKPYPKFTSGKVPDKRNQPISWL